MRRSGAKVDRTSWSCSFFAGLLLAILITGCSAQRRRVEGPPEVDVPSFATSYSTRAGSNGVRGGSVASDAENRLREYLQARGDKAEPDTALAATAAWALRSAYSKEPVSDATIATQGAQRFGFTGIIHGVMIGPLEEERARVFLKELVAQVPKNSPINRYGIMGGTGSNVAVVI